ncbi:MAG: hypothetical protein ACREK5_07835, partial [Gemmatimonadota bacterium]
PAQEQLEVALTVHPNGGTRTSLRQKEIGSGDPTVTMFYQILCNEPGIGWFPANGEVDSLYHVNLPFATGGHVEPPGLPEPKHDLSNTAEGRPVGTYDLTSGPTGFAGMFGPTEFTANIAGGEELVIVDYRMTDPQSSCFEAEARALFRAIIEVPGLTGIPNHPDITLDTYPPTGDLTSHDAAGFWYLTAETIEKTKELGRLHRQDFHAPVYLTAASLVQGGVNDAGRDWDPENPKGHWEHRIGTDVDIDDQAGNDADRLDDIVLLGRRSGFVECAVHKKNHVHCRQFRYSGNRAMLSLRMPMMASVVLSLLLWTNLRAQIGEIPLPYPGWIPSDRVEPTITVHESYDAFAAAWHYDYTIANAPTAEQDIRVVELTLRAWTDDVQAPVGWRYFSRSVDTFNPQGPGINSTLFKATLPSGPLTADSWPASPYQIPPGDSLSGFAQSSAYPPGYSRTYTQGYSGSPFPPDPSVDPDAYYAMNPIPHDTTNSQRGWTLGPTIYTEVLTPGDDGLTTDNFLRWMNISDFATILIDPAPIALKFSVVGETVFPETFQAILNGVDVAEAFLPGPPDGADQVAVFRLGSSPLVEGLNVIQTSIEGIEGITGVRGTDIDIMRFRVDPECSVPQTIVCPS